MIREPRMIKLGRIAQKLCAMAKDLPSAEKAHFFLRSYVRFVRAAEGRNPFRNQQQT